jgi:hypothetical protein
MNKFLIMMMFLFFLPLIACNNAVTSDCAGVYIAEELMPRSPHVDAQLEWASQADRLAESLYESAQQAYKDANRLDEIVNSMASNDPNAEALRQMAQKWREEAAEMMRSVEKNKIRAQEYRLAAEKAWDSFCTLVRQVQGDPLALAEFREMIEELDLKKSDNANS